MVTATFGDQVVDSTFITAWRYRHEGVSPQQVALMTGQLELTTAEVEAMFLGVDAVIRYCVYENLDKAAVPGLFSPSFHAALAGLFGKIIGAHLPEWREQALSNPHISAPKLLDFDWRIDHKRSSNFLTRMSVPTVILDMKIQQQPKVQGMIPGVDDIQFELPKEALATMLDGLCKIRDQLSSIK